MWPSPLHPHSHPRLGTQPGAVPRMSEAGFVPHSEGTERPAGSRYSDRLRTGRRAGLTGGRERLVPGTRAAWTRPPGPRGSQPPQADSGRPLGFWLQPEGKGTLSDGRGRQTGGGGRSRSAHPDGGARKAAPANQGRQSRARLAQRPHRQGARASVPNVHTGTTCPPARRPHVTHRARQGLWCATWAGKAAFPARGVASEPPPHHRRPTRKRSPFRKLRPQ